VSHRHRIEDGKGFSLADVDPDDTGKFSSKEEADAQTAADLLLLRDLHEKMYVDGRYSLLVVLQAMDTGGKDGTIKHVFTGVNPQGCQVTSFKKPSTEELAHDFLWRIDKAVPARGTFGIFNRSHYEDVLVVRVHELVSKKIWKKRFDAINAFEERLANEGTIILKFFLYISKNEQKERILARINDPKKQWKFTEDDLAERKHWDDYIEAYEDAIKKCSRPHAPWYVVPANKKWYRNYVVANALVKTLSKLDLKLPESKIDFAKLKFK
jgi:PPK2 family polyphosphate:nucleotide phosphotransferase